MQFRTVGFLARLRDSFWRHRWLFLLTVLTVVGVTTAALALRKPTFHATASAQVVTDSEALADALGETERYSYVSQSQQQVNHFQDLLGDDRPDGFLDTALQNAHLARPINIDPRVKDPRAAMLRKGLSVTSDSSMVFTLGLTWDDATECERILQALLNQYIDEVGVDRQAKSVATTQFLNNQIKDYTNKMTAAENALSDYKMKNSGELPENQAADIQQLASLKIQRDSLAIEVNDSTMRRAALEKRMTDMPRMSILEQTVAAGPEQEALRNLIARRSVLLSQGYQPTSKEVGDISAEIDNVRGLAAADAAATARAERANGGVATANIVQTKRQNNPQFETLSQQLSDAEIAENTQKSRLAELDRQIGIYEQRIAKIPEAQRILTDKTRNYTLYRAAYDKLVEQRQQAEMKANLDKLTATSTLLPVGTIYAEPTTPRSKQMLMFAGSFLLSLVVGVTVVILSEWGDMTLRYGSDAERILDVPVLAELPELRARPLPAAR